MNINDCDDYKYIEDRIFDFEDEWLNSRENDYEIYAYAINKQNSDLFSENDYANYFLFRLFPILPDINDCRYEVIKKYTSSNSEFGIERNRCIAFELAVRNKKNIEDIDKVFEYYAEYGVILKELITVMERHGREHVLTSGRDDFKQMREHMNELCSLAKALKLIPYKNYPESNMLSHWGLKPMIYKIVGFCFYYENGGMYKFDEQVSEEQKLNFTYNTIGFREIDDESAGRVLKLNNAAVLHQKYSLPENFLGSLDNDTSIFEGLNAEELKSELQDPSKINNKILHIFQYPQLETYSKITIEIELSSFKTNINKFLVDAIDSLANIDKKYFSEDTLLNIRTNTDETQYEIKFFIYDYFTYRLEQNKHMLKFGLIHDVMEIIEDAKDNIYRDTTMSKADHDKKLDVYTRQEVKKLKASNKLTKETIYAELALILELKPATVKSYLLEISKKIETPIC